MQAMMMHVASYSVATHAVSKFSTPIAIAIHVN